MMIQAVWKYACKTFIYGDITGSHKKLINIRIFSKHVYFPRITFMADKKLAKITQSSLENFSNGNTLTRFVLALCAKRHITTSGTLSSEAKKNTIKSIIFIIASRQPDVWLPNYDFHYSNTLNESRKVQSKRLRIAQTSRNLWTNTKTWKRKRFAKRTYANKMAVTLDHKMTDSKILRLPFK